MLGKSSTPGGGLPGHQSLAYDFGSRPSPPLASVSPSVQWNPLSFPASMFQGCSETRSLQSAEPGTPCVVCAFHKHELLLQSLGCLKQNEKKGQLVLGAASGLVITHSPDRRKCSSPHWTWGQTREETKPLSLLPAEALCGR